MKVLIAVEDKKFTDAISEFLVQHQKWSADTQFKIIHVVEPLYMGSIPGYSNDVLNSFMEERLSAGRSLTLSIGTDLRTKYPKAQIIEEVLKGRPKEVIVETARTWQADLIVVGSHGRSGISSFLLGSVSMSVLSAAPCSVMIVKLSPEQLKDTQKEKEAVAGSK